MIKVIWPEYITVKDWADRLVSDFLSESIPILENDANWESWGNIVATTGVFADAGVPSPFSIIDGKKQPNFKTWEDWAKNVYNLMANQ